MPNVHNTLFYRHDGCVIVIIHGDIKCGASHGNYRSGCENPIIIGLSAPLLDVYLHPADQDIQQIAPVAGILTEDNIGVRIDFKSTPIGNLELRIAVWTGDNDLLDLHLVADVERPGYSTPERGYIAV